ncbi:MAG TPA: alkaline phosphatase D family protein [Bryobacteraceae bacterium]|nr:alkaline phosphatase D family protein [Bryobacteraceae bacterium]
MNRRKACLLIAATPALPRVSQGAASESGDRPWIGPEYWSNPLQDWRLRGGRIECCVSGGDRNVYLLTHEAAAGPGSLTMRVRLGRLEEDTASPEPGFAGFRAGIRGRQNDYRDNAIYGIGLDAGVSTDGRLFVGKLEEKAPRVAEPLQDVDLLLEASSSTGAASRVRLAVFDAGGKLLAETVRDDISSERLTGGVALVSSAGRVEDSPDPSAAVVTMSGINKRNSERGGNVRFWFRNWTVAGSRVRVHEDRAWGPILFTMHTASRGVLKLTAQMAPVALTRERVRLQVQRGAKNEWKTIATAQIDALARTATFRVPKWPTGADVPYRVAYKMGREHTFDGTIPKDPAVKPKIVLGALSCNNDFGFPHADIVHSVRHFRPDLVAFVGDQIYERVAGYGIQRLPLEPAVLDYLRKWYLFGWEYRDILRDTPSVCMPDDHDVFHGNVWGAGGRRAEGVGYAGQDSGGYIEPAAWVNMVQRTQTSHLPDPVDPTPIEQGIGVYYTELLRGGVSFAIIEDRKWKSAPKEVLPNAKIVNGWAQNPAHDNVRDGDVRGAQLLGPRQERFLDRWAADWTGGTWMKALLTQTLFANLATLPPPADNDSVTGKLPILRPDGYSEGEVHTADHDSNGWPQTPRNRALRAIRRCFAVHITGDQHLGSTIQYGIDDWNDGSWAICTPAVSNIFPRRWYPPKPGRNPKPHSPRNTGEFLDGFGNRMTVHAVFNPQQRGEKPDPLLDRSPGYGIIEFDRSTRKTTLAVWPRREDPERPGARPCPGWPITIDQLDNGFPHKGHVLETIRLMRRELCVQVIRESTGEIVYTMRLTGQPITLRVFEEGAYAIRVFEPDGDWEETRRNVWTVPAPVA